MADAASAPFPAVVEEPAAFRSWYDTALPKVYGFVLARCGGDTNLAVELTQDAFVAAVRSRASFTGESDAVTWVCGIARHRVADHFRREARERRRRLRVIEGGLDDGDDHNPMDDLDERDAVAGALARLPRDQAVVLAMHYLDGLPVRDIARDLGRSAKSIESLLVRGRDGFRQVYRRADRGEDR